MNKNILNILKTYYGYNSFRKGQENIINSIIDGYDVLAIMPTGSGKSICYQLPAMCFKGITIVISPLISLMKDQVDSLNTMGIKAAYINSSMSTQAYKQTLNAVIDDEYKILYVAPERLENIDFLNIIKTKKISQIAVDEAHCISQWGHDFRISYKKIPTFINNLSTRPVITAFTATASDEVRADILTMLGLKSPKVYITGFDRENLFINIINNSAKNRYLLEYIKNHEMESGIIYAATRKEVENIYKGLSERNISVLKYHAGMSNEDRKQNQDKFIHDEVSIMVATNAFGMGIDKPNIRWIIHYNMPQSIENYYQEIGRAGRDGEKSECIMLFSQGDVHIQKYLIETSTENISRKSVQYSKLQQMVDLVYSNSCYRKYILRYFGEVVHNDCGNCSNCKNEGILVDKTLDSQKVISCVIRMKRNFGINTIVDVLRGSKSKKILELDFDKLSTYGIMKNYSADELKIFINTLISHKILDIKENTGLRGSFPTVHLNNNSMKVIKGEMKVEFKEQPVKNTIEKRDELFIKLVALRKELSSRENIAPYMIFGDATLNFMSNKYPTTKEEMLNISGVGEVKYEKYGQIFIDTIKSYMLENNIKEQQIDEEESKFFEVNTDKKLYELLRALRIKLAAKENTASYMIMKNDTIKEISGRYPLTEDNLKDISGMGPKKIEKYGKQVLDIVNKYVSDNNISFEWKDKKRKKLILDGESRKNNEIAMDLLNQGVDIKKVSQELEISVSTILGYICDYLKEENKINFNIDTSIYYCDDEKIMIEEKIAKYGEEKIREIKNNLPDYIRYESIRAVILEKYIS